MANVSNLKDSSPDTDDIAKQLQAVKADLAKLTEVVSGYAAAKGTEARDRVTREAEALSAEARARYDRTAAEADRIAREAGDLVRERPGMAVGMAAAVGFLVGYLGARR
ncbi:DUF883 family protein [Rhodobacterales bacterium HKCCE2091]|nr:DUF883 family protein [Rhodobacterales bacterium HKCCE2091]